MTTATPSPRRAKTRARLLAAAADAFAERGVFGTSVEDVCERAQFTRGAFYSNFASRDELVVAVAAQRTALVHDRLRELTASGIVLTPSELLREVLDIGDDPGERARWVLLQTEFTLHALRDPQAGAAWAEHLAQVHEQTARLLADYAHSAGVHLPISADDLARLLYAAFVSGATQHLLAPRDVRHLQLPEALVRLVEQAGT